MKLDKEKLLAALYAMQNGDQDVGCFHDELETLIGILTNLHESVIEAAWKELQRESEVETE